MSKSLQDQLLGAGLIDKKKAKKLTNTTKKEKHEKRRNNQSLETDVQASAKQALADKQEKDRLLNLEKQASVEKKAILAQVLQLINHYKILNRSGDVEFNFTDGKTIKKMRLEKSMFEKVSCGTLSVVGVNEVYELVPRPVAEKIRERMPEVVIVDNYGKGTQEQSDSDDDYYADFEIPDDLMW